MNYDNLIQDATALLQYPFVSEDKAQIEANSTTKGTMLLVVSLKAGGGKVIPLSSLLLHRLSNFCYVSYAVTRRTTFNKSLHKEGDGETFQGRGLLASLLLLTTELCQLYQSSRLLYVQCQNSNGFPNETIFRNFGFKDIDHDDDGANIQLMCLTAVGCRSSSNLTLFLRHPSLKTLKIQARPNIVLKTPEIRNKKRQRWCLQKGKQVTLVAKRMRSVY